MIKNLEISQPFEASDIGENSLFLIDGEFAHSGFSIEADFDEDPAYWSLVYIYPRHPWTSAFEADILMEVDLTELPDSENFIEELLNTPITGWSWS